MVAIKNFLFGALFAAAAVAQNTNFTAAEIEGLANGSTPFSPTTSMKVAWCQAQMSLCGTLCSGDNSNNHCDNMSLNWTCTCSNMSTPGLQYYSFSIIGNECHALQNNCVQSNPNDAAAQQNCMTKYTCGNATQADAEAAASAGSGSSSSPSTTASPTGSTAAQTSAAASSTPTHNAAPAYKVYGTGAAAVAALGFVVAAL